MTAALDFIAHLGGWMTFVWLGLRLVGKFQCALARRQAQDRRRRDRSQSVVRDLARATGARTASEEVRL